MEKILYDKRFKKHLLEIVKRDYFYVISIKGPWVYYLESKKLIRKEDYKTTYSFFEEMVEGALKTRLNNFQ
jgi:predicted small secreted protein